MKKVVLVLLLSAMPMALFAQDPAQEDPNIAGTKYDITDAIEDLLHPEHQRPSGRANAAQRLADLKDSVALYSLEEMFQKEAIPALEEAAENDEDELVRTEAALALKRIRDDGPNPRVSNGTYWVEVVEIRRGGELGGRVFRPSSSSDVLLQINFQTDDPSIIEANFFDDASKYCGILHSASEEPNSADLGGGSFQDRSEKLCGFAVPLSARGFKFKLEGFPEVDLRF